MKKLKNIFLSVLLGTLVVVCNSGCGKNTAEYISSESSEEVYVSETNLAEGSHTGDAAEKEQATVCIYVCGEVNAPGVYELLEGSRVRDAFTAAQGLTEKAAKDYWNQARVLTDGEMIYVPSEEEAKDRTPESNPTNAEKKSSKININTASKEELMTLPGVGESKAESILSYRKEHGGFSDIEEIMDVNGIKEGMYEKIKEYIVVN